MSTRSTPSPYSLAPIRRIVTGHTPDGKASITRDERLVSVSASPVPGDTDALQATRIWTTKKSPVVHSEETDEGGTDGPDRLGLVCTNGINFGSWDLAPGHNVTLHRTSTLDYVILVSGEATVILEDGTERTLSEPGTILIQRGTVHRWENRGSDWFRFLAVLLDAKPVETVNEEGKVEPLEEGIFI